ncbi:MAG: PKD domain-containing protein [Bacteroidota bacterium]
MEDKKSTFFIFHKNNRRAVFIYLNTLITTTVDDGIVTILIEKERNEGSSDLAWGSPFWSRRDCGIANSVVEKILFGASDFELGAIHGIICLNEFYENQFFTDLINAPTANDNGKFHLYTVALHEALHILGLNSLIDETGVPIGINGRDQVIDGQAYSRWDQYLFSETENNFLIAPTSGSCCNAHTYQLSNNPTSDCSLSFRNDGIDLASIDGEPFIPSEITNLLSHFNINCDQGAEQYVLHPRLPALGTSSGFVAPIRGQLTCTELQALYLIGYDVVGAINQAGCSLPNGGGCDVIIEDDVYVLYPANGEDLTLNLPIADIVANDYLTNSYENFDYTSTSDPNFTVTDDGTSLMITITDDIQATYTIDYSLTACNGTLCDEGVIYIIVSACDAQACQDCDILGIGDFECFEIGFNGAADIFPEFRLSVKGHPDLQGASAYGYRFDQTDISANTPDLGRVGEDNPFFNFGEFQCNGFTAINTIPSMSGNQYVGMGHALNAATGEILGREGLVLPLREEIEPGETVDIDMFVQSRNSCVSFDPRVLISFLSTDFKDDQERARTERVIVNQNPAWTGTNPSWQIKARYEIDNNTTPIVRSTGISITKPATDTENWAYLVVYPEITPIVFTADINRAYLLVDDIRITKQKSITINPTPSNAQVCEGGQVIIDYELLNGCSPSGDLDVDITVPTGLTLQATGVFENGTAITLSSFAPEESRTIQAVFTVDAGVSAGQILDVMLEVAPNDPTSCYLSSNDVQSIEIVANPLTSISKNFVVEDDGDYRFELTVCNGSEQNLNAVQIIDFLPPEFEFVTDNPADDPFLFTMVTNDNQVELITTIGAASGGVENCQTFYYTARFTGTFCPYTSFALARVSDSNCDDVSTTFELEDPNLPALDAGFTFSVDCTNGVTTFTSNTTASGITHNWDFGDGSAASSLANPTHTYAAAGTYRVIHDVTNACGTVTEAIDVTYEPCPNTFNCSCTNPTQIGSPPNGTTNISTTGFPPNINNTTGGCIQIGGTLIIDTDFAILGGDVLMEPDAQIIVRPNVNFSITQANVRSCNDYMWKNIKVESDGNLTLTSNTISDADVAVELEGTASFNILSNTFDRNRIGILIRRIPINLGLSNNIFSCSSALNNGRWGDFGIRMFNTGNDQQFFQIGTASSSTTATNTFRDTHYGIAATNTWLNVFDAVFEDLRYDQSVRQLQVSNGTAVYADQNSRLNASDNTIDRAYIGIAAIGSSCGIDDNAISSANIGVLTQDFFLGEKVEVQNNQIEAAEGGVIFFNHLASSPKIKNNTIEIDLNQYEYVPVTNAFAEIDGIFISIHNAGGQGGYLEIENNDLTIQTLNEVARKPFAHGIRLVSANNVDIEGGNTMMLKGDPIATGGFGVGIDIRDSDNVLISESDIQDDANLEGKAITAFASTDVSYCCNNLVVKGEMLNFSGSCEGTALNENSIGSSAVTSRSGLVCEVGTVIGEQVFTDENTGQQRHRANRWLAAGYTEYGAVHEDSDVGVVNLSQFSVNNSDPNDNFRPSNAMLENVEPVNFFVDREILAVATCDENFECNLNSSLNTQSSRLASIANRPDFTVSPYKEMLNWESKQYLYRRLSKNINPLQSNEQLQDFYQTYQHTDLAELQELQQHFDFENLITNSNLNELRMAMQEMIELLAQFQSNYQNEVSETEKDELIEFQKRNIRDFQEIQTRYSDIITDLGKNMNELLERTRFENSLLINANILGQNEQIVNHFYLLYLLNNDIDLVIADNQMLFEVANQCPKEGGRSVYKARILYNTIVEAHTWKDDHLCGIVENRVLDSTSILVSDQIIEDEVFGMTLFPNPVYTSLNIVLDNFDVERNISFQLYDLSGRIVLNQSLESQNTKILISHLKEGVYLAYLYLDGAQKDIKKVVLIK